MEGGSRYSGGGGGVDLLSETYTQLHTIDGLADPQTYKFKSDLSISLLDTTPADSSKESSTFVWDVVTAAASSKASKVGVYEQTNIPSVRFNGLTPFNTKVTTKQTLTTPIRQPGMWIDCIWAPDICGQTIHNIQKWSKDLGSFPGEPILSSALRFYHFFPSLPGRTGM